MAESDELRELLLGLMRQLVDTPDGVTVEATEDGGGTLFRLTVAPGEVGQIIGKSGRTARALSGRCSKQSG